MLFPLEDATVAAMLQQAAHARSHGRVNSGNGLANADNALINAILEVAEARSRAQPALLRLYFNWNPNDPDAQWGLHASRV